MAKWKLAGARKKKKSVASKGRLVSCLVLLVGILLLFFWLFSLILRKPG